MEKLRKSLLKILKSYKEIKDIIIFGSLVKGRSNPEDLDLALLVTESDLGLISKVKKELGLNQVHLELIFLDELIYNTLFLSLVNEGYSVLKGKYLNELLGTKPKLLYAYDLIHLNQSQKTLFGKALRLTLVKTKGIRVSAGAVLIPLSQSSYFEDFLKAWEMKYKTREWTVI